MGYWPLLRRGPVLWLWVAETLSSLGDRFLTLALMWLVWRRAGAGAMGLVVVIESVAHILVGVAGRRLRARFASLRALAVLELAQVGVVAALPLLWARVGLVGVLVVIAVIGTADAITNPAVSAITPELVTVDQVQHVTGLMQLSGRLTWVVGPACAGLLLTVMPTSGLFAADAATFAISFVVFLRLARQVNTSVPVGSPASPGSPSRGWRVRAVLRAYPGMACALVLDMLGEAAQAVFTVGIPIWLTARLHAGPDAYGLVISAMGAGALAGNLIIGHARLPECFPGGFCLAWALRGALLVAYAASGQVWQVIVVTAAGGAFTPLTSVLLATRIGQQPALVRMPLFSANLTSLHVAGVVSMLVLPPLLTEAPADGFVAGGGLTVLAALVVWVAAAALGRRASAPTPVVAETLTRT